jgi:hypothetical protein
VKSFADADVLLVQVVVCTVAALMNSKPTPVTPDALRIDQALQASVPLVRLVQRMRESNARFQHILPHLPGMLAPHVKPGPLDEQGWSLLAANASVAAKLRQLQPRFEEVLLEKGWQPVPVRVKVQSMVG